MSFPLSDYDKSRVRMSRTAFNLFMLQTYTKAQIKEVSWRLEYVAAQRKHNYRADVALHLRHLGFTYRAIGVMMELSIPAATRWVRIGESRRRRGWNRRSPHWLAVAVGIL